MSDVYDLRALPLFAECDDPELDLVARLLTPIDASPGRILMVQDGLARQFVIVESGEVEVVHHQPDGTDHVVTLGPDSWVGEVGLINHVPCTATVSTRHGARVHVVVHQHQGRSVGLIVDSVLDVVEEAAALDGGRARPGVAGCAVIQGRITEVLDMERVLALGLAAGLGRAEEATHG